MFKSLTAAAVAIMAIVGGAGTAGAVAASAAPAYVPPPVSYYAQSYGTNAQVLGSTVTSGATALAQVSCTAVGGTYRSNTSASTDLGVAGSLGSTASHSASIRHTSSKEAAANSTIANVNLLGGLITASSVTARSASVLSSTGLSAHQSSTLAGLVVAGTPIAADVAPNTTLPISESGHADFAQVILNQQAGSRTSSYVSSADVALRVKILTDNSFGLAIGTDIIVARAGTKLYPYQPGYLSGHAAGTYVSSGIVNSGFTGDAKMLCSGGTSGHNVAGVDLSPIGAVGAITSSTNSRVSTSVATGTTTSTVASADLLNGTVAASGITASTTASHSLGHAPVLTDNSSFGSLTILGQDFTNAPVNTPVLVPGLGNVIVHSVTRSGHSIYVAMLKITLTQASGGYPSGTKILIGYSTSSTS